MAESAVPDVLAPDLRIVFSGINPGFRSARAAAHFANPRNDFWRLLADAGLTPRLLAPEEQWELLELGYGLTNAAYRTTKGSGDLRRGDFAGSAERFERLAADLQPDIIAFVGKAAYEGVFVWAGSHGVHIGFDAHGLFVRDSETKAPRFRARRSERELLPGNQMRWRDSDGTAEWIGVAALEQHLRLEVVDRIFSAEDHAFVVEALEAVFRAAVDEGTAVVWC